VWRSCRWSWSDGCRRGGRRGCGISGWGQTIDVGCGDFDYAEAVGWDVFDPHSKVCFGVLRDADFEVAREGCPDEAGVELGLDVELEFAAGGVEQVAIAIIDVDHEGDLADAGSIRLLYEGQVGGDGGVVHVEAMERAFDGGEGSEHIAVGDGGLSFRGSGEHADFEKDIFRTRGSAGHGGAGIRGAGMKGVGGRLGGASAGAVVVGGRLRGDPIGVFVVVSAPVGELERT